MKKIFLAVSLSLLFGFIAFAANYNVDGLTFNGYMLRAGDVDWLTLGGQEGANPNICLSHAAGVDFDFEVYNDGQKVCSNIEMGTKTCCRANTPGSAKVKVWSDQGSGNYTLTIQP
jgi:hypothetical protein